MRSVIQPEADKFESGSRRLNDKSSKYLILQKLYYILKCV